MTGEYQNAIDDFSKSIGLNPRNADAFYSRGICYFHKLEYEKAILDLKKAVDLGDHQAKEALKRYFNIKYLALSLS